MRNGLKRLFIDRETNDALPLSQVCFGALFLFGLHFFLSWGFTGLTPAKMNAGYIGAIGDPTGSLAFFSFPSRIIADKGFWGLFSTVNPYLGAPLGVDNVYSPLFNLYIAFLSLFGNEFFVYNVMAFNSFLLSGLTSFLLCWYVTRSFPASLAGSVIFTYCPYHSARVLGHLSFAMTEFLPLFLLSLLLFYHKPTFARGAFFALNFAFLSAINMYYGFFCFVAAVALLGFFLYRYFRRAGVKEAPVAEKILWGTAPFWWIGLVGAVAFFATRVALFSRTTKAALVDFSLVGRYLLLAMATTACTVLGMFPFFAGQFSHDPDSIDNVFSERNPIAMAVYSTRGYDYFLPSVYQQWSWEWIKPAVAVTTEFHLSSPLEQTVFVGFVPLFLMLVVYRIARSDKEQAPGFDVRLFLFFTIVMFCASLPSHFSVLIGDMMGESLVFWRFTNTPLGELYEKLPVFRAVSRFGIMVQLGVALLSSMSLLWLFRRYLLQRRGRFLLTGAVVFLTLADFWPMPPAYTPDTARSELTFRYIKERPKDEIVVEYPLHTTSELGTYLYLYHSVVHKHPILNLLPKRFWFTQEFHDRADYLLAPGVIEMLGKLGVKMIVLHGPPLWPLPPHISVASVDPATRTRVYDIEGIEPLVSPEDYGDREKMRVVFKTILGKESPDKKGDK